jgi:hypothetical protein
MGQELRWLGNHAGLQWGTKAPYPKVDLDQRFVSTFMSRQPRLILGVVARSAFNGVHLHLRQDKPIAALDQSTRISTWILVKSFSTPSTSVLQLFRNVTWRLLPPTRSRLVLFAAAHLIQEYTRTPRNGQGIRTQSSS